MKKHSLQTLFQMGMKRELDEALAPEGYIIELGPGENPVPGAHGLEFPGWDGMKHNLPYQDESVDGVYAFHFMEHLTGERAIEMLREIQRVLVPGGIATIVVPHRSAMLAYQDLDHKSFWCEETMRNLFQNPYYKKHGAWRFKIRLNVMMGIVERNMGLFIQLERI